MEYKKIEQLEKETLMEGSTINEELQKNPIIIKDMEKKDYANF